jgi:UDP:flavonoid glycosyltransferase YjiC (YdhE family)
MKRGVIRKSDNGHRLNTGREMRAEPFRILFMPSAIGFAHLGRLLSIADVLRRVGYQIIFAYGGEHGSLLTKLGYEWLSIKDVSLPEQPRFDQPILEQYTEDLAERCIQADLLAYAHIRPQGVVSDLRPTAAISARMAGIPHVAVLNGYITRCFDAARLLVDPAENPLKYRLTRWLMRQLLGAQGWRLAAGLRSVAQRHGAHDRQFIWDFFEGDLNLLADLPGFVPLSDAPATYHTTGPLIWEGTGEPYPALPPRAPGQRRIYITAGNTGSRQLLDTALAAFADRRDAQVVMTTGAYLDPAPYRGRPNIHVARFLPGSAVMEQSDLVIHSGGSGTTYQCLQNGLPAIVVPSNNEQMTAARLARYHKVGVPLALRDLTPARLYDLAAQMLERQLCRNHAVAFKARFAAPPGAAAAASLIVAFIEGQPAQPAPDVPVNILHQELERANASA